MLYLVYIKVEFIMIFKLAKICQVFKMLFISGGVEMLFFYICHVYRHWDMLKSHSVLTEALLKNASQQLQSCQTVFPKLNLHRHLKKKLMKSCFTAHVQPFLMNFWGFEGLSVQLRLFLDYRMQKSFASLGRMREIAVYNFLWQTFTLGW